MKAHGHDNNNLPVESRMPEGRVMPSSTQRAGGFTLVELLISMTLGIVISIAAVQLFVTGLSSYNLQRGVGDINENGRFALDYIVRNVRQTMSLPSSLGANPGPVAIGAGSLPGVAAGLTSQNDVTALGIGVSDQLVVRSWVPSNPQISMPEYRDCEGNIVPPGNFSVARYFVRADAASGSAAALACDAGYYSPTAFAMTNYGDAGVVLLTSVDSFQVLYGITPTAPGATVRYVTSNLVGANAVNAVRLGILVRSTDSVGGFANDPLAVNVLDVPLTSVQLKTANNNLVRRVFTSTIAFRNQM